MKTKPIMSVIALLLSLWVGTSFAAGRGTPGAVYAMTNDADGNKIVIFDRKANGELTDVGTIETGGRGSGPGPANNGLDPLGSQGSLVLSQDHRWLLAVNAGSDEISVFKVLPRGLSLVNNKAVSSGGEFPVSVAIYHDLVYVLNASTPNITAFTLGFRGALTPLPNSTRSLESGAYAQVGFDPQGNNLVVTDKENGILVFSLESDGTPSPSPAPVTTPSSDVPFGFIFDRRGHLLVSEASGAASSYRILPDNTLQRIGERVGNGQVATCWIARNNRGDIFTSNTGSGTVSTYELLAGDGSLLLRNATAGAAVRPIDMAISADGRFLYALDPAGGDPAGGAVHMFRIDRDGGLTDLGAITPTTATAEPELSIFANGIAAR